MDSDLDLNAIPLSSFNHDIRNLLSCLLNSKKILSSDEPEKLPRDWRGLASLINIPTEIVSNINEYPDKTGQVLDIWTKRDESAANLGKLMEYLERIDRFDVYDDLLDLIKSSKFVVPNTKLVALNKIQIAPRVPSDDIITSGDRLAGIPQYYHAFVLYANENHDDREFANMLLTRMRDKGFKLCTLYDLEIGHHTQYAPATQLISERCRRIILIYSPSFLDSPDNKFYTDYAQAVGIESKQRKIIPIIYRPCKVPINLMFYHRLVYHEPGKWAPYDFWLKLSESLQQVTMPQREINGEKSSRSGVNITEVTASTDSERNGYAPHTSHADTASTSSTCDLTEHVPISQLEDTRSQSSMSLSNLSEGSQTSKEKKKNGVIGNIKNIFKKNKPKKILG